LRLESPGDRRGALAAESAASGDHLALVLDDDTRIRMVSRVTCGLSQATKSRPDLISS
jgi:hypothetical protein